MTTRGLAHPLPLASIALLLVNDHVLKRACPSWLTGKLSDFAGLFFFPILLVAIAELGPAARRRRSLVAAIACVATAIVFAAIKAVPACNALANRVGTFVLDPTDLVALVSVAAAWVFLDRPAPSGVARWQTGLAIVVASGASVATSPSHLEPKYPMWTVLDGGPTVLGCAEVEAWIPKSGSEGFGLTIAIDAPSDCRPRVEASFRAGAVSRTSALVAPEGEKRRFVYLPFSFDNTSLFDGHVEAGEIVVTIDDGQPHTRVLKVAQRAVPALARYASRSALPIAFRGPVSMMTSCGPVHARAEFVCGDYLRSSRHVVFTVAPGCRVDVSGVWRPVSLSPEVGAATARENDGRRIELNARRGPSDEVAGDLWIELPAGASMMRAKLELELHDGERRVPWVIELDAHDFARLRRPPCAE